MSIIGTKLTNEMYVCSEHVVVWSGGCDSTLLLKEVAEEYGTPNRPVVALSIEHFLIGDRKNEIEKLKRTELLEELTKRGLNIVHHTFKIEGTVNMRTNSDNPTQSYIWLSQVLSYVPEDAKLYFGFIRPDDDVMRLDRLKKLNDSLCEHLCKKVTLETPYIFSKKEDILKELMEADLYDKVWYCEMPHYDDMEPCGYCIPCKTHKEAILHMAYDGDERAMTLLPKHMKVIKKHLPKKGFLR